MYIAIVVNECMFTKDKTVDTYNLIFLKIYKISICT
jgi:hypothetical protein